MATHDHASHTINAWVYFLKPSRLRLIKLGLAVLITLRRIVRRMCPQIIRTETAISQLLQNTIEFITEVQRGSQSQREVCS